MSIDCKYWKEHRAGGTCSQGNYGGRPSIGTCLKVCKLGLVPVRVLTGKAIVPPVLEHVKPAVNRAVVNAQHKHVKGLAWSDVKEAYLKDWPDGLPEIEMAEKQWTPELTGCTSCQAKARMVKYMQRLQDAIKLKQVP